MRIIISPAKKMNRNEDLLVWEGKPVFWQDGEKILAWMRKLSYSQAKELWCCNDSIAEKITNGCRIWICTETSRPPFWPMMESNISIWRLRFLKTGCWTMCRNICGFCLDFTVC